jgi:membrane protease YdiL (CAAX protease family)
MAGLLTTAVGLSAAAGYQILARASRPPSSFRGPSPAIMLGLQLILSIAFGTVWLILNVPDPRTSSVGFLAVSTTLLATYLGVVWLFGVRTGALGWRDMGFPTWVRSSLPETLRGMAVGSATMLLLWPVVIILAGVLAQLLNSRTVEVIPPVVTTTDLLLTALGAAILVPIGEEVLFRGYALTAWLRDLGPRSALIRSTLFFAVAHVLGVTASTFDDGARQALLTVVVITPVGAALGWLFLRRGLVAAIAGHATFNLVGVLAYYLAQSVPRPT